MAPGAAGKRRKQFTLDVALLSALENLAREQGARMDELAAAAFRDFLKKKNVPIGLADALRASTRAAPANDPIPAAGPKTPLKRSDRKR